MSSFSEGFVLSKVTSFAATMGLILATIANLPHSASAANRDELWVVVHDICVPAYQSIGVAFPCAEVSIADGLERGFAVLRAPSSATHVIVVPTMRISGIESPALLSENAPNYWEAAWDARHFVEEGARRQLPRDKIGMAVNSAASRSQDQLHIHVEGLCKTCGKTVAVGPLSLSLTVRSTAGLLGIRLLGPAADLCF
jgi:CDP-diacylglycerol pyrophosphatase